MSSPSIGRTVHYRLDQSDVDEIKQHRKASGEHQCNDVEAGQVFPAVIVAVWGGGLINCKVMLDGRDTHWSTSRELGTRPGTWSWPPRDSDAVAAVAVERLGFAAVGIVLLTLLFPAIAHAAEAAAGGFTWRDILPGIVEIVSPFLVLALTWIGHKAAAYFGARTKNEYLHGLFIRLNDRVMTAVKAVQQSYVDALKRGRADGTLTSEEKTAAAAAAMEALKSYIGPKGLDELAAVLGLDGLSLDGYLGDKIEAAVHDLRASKAAAPLALPSAQ